MKKKIIITIALCLLLTVGCKSEYSTTDWSGETFFDGEVYVPKSNDIKLSKDREENGKTSYTAIVNEFTYDEFYKYIMALEEKGYHYEFLNESVPSDVNKLADKTETSWAGSKGDIYIIANWRSKDNIYYNGYNLQLLLYNYDVTKSDIIDLLDD